MSDWSFWKGFVSGAALTSLVTVLKVPVLIKELWPRRAKPRLLDAKNCCILAFSGGEHVEFDLLVDNAGGTKDCSVISVELRCPNGVITDLNKAHLANFRYEPSTQLPTTISAGRTERIIASGYTNKANRFKLQPKQHSVEATAVVKFNTGKTIEKKISFIIEHT